jgi:hypothetical protein
MPKFLDALGEKLGIVKKPVPPPPPTPKPDKVEPIWPEPQVFTPVPAADKLVAWAKAQVGKPYSAYRDCSGFTAAAFRQIGKTIPEGSVAQYQWSEPISEDFLPGDLAFWDTFGPSPGHVALYVGNGRVIHALNEQRGIIESDLNANMGGPYMGIRRLPVLDGTTPGKPEAPVASAVPVGTSASSVGASTNFRQCPRITLDQTRAIIKAVPGSPLNSEIEAIHNAMQGDPLPLAQSWMESRYGQDPNAKRTHNPLGLLWFQGSPISSYTNINVGGGVVVPLLNFPNYAAAFKEWRRRMDDPRYKNGVYPQGMTLIQFIYTYVGGPQCLDRGICANGETQASCNHYFTETMERVNRYYKVGSVVTPPPTPTGYKAHTIPGLGAPLLLPENIPVRTRMTPMGVAGRSGRRLQAPYQVTRHTTNNYQPGTNAWHHAGWQAGGASGNPGIAVHAYSDDVEVVIAMPFDEQGIHAGDWRNQNSVAFELCRQQGINRARAEQIAIALDAAALHARGLNVENNLWPHTNGGHCPDLSMAWPEWERRVNVDLQKLKAL